jgi:hypothetical protein
MIIQKSTLLITQSWRRLLMQFTSFGWSMNKQKWKMKSQKMSLLMEKAHFSLGLGVVG